MIKLTQIYYYIFGVLTVIGGVIGYVKAQSIPSLVAGSVSGALLVFAGVLVSTKVQPALIVGLLISLALASYFVYAYTQKPVFMPAGLMIGMSAIGIALTVITLLSPRH